MNECEFLKYDEFNDRFLCTVNNEQKEIPLHFVRICKSEYHKYCPNKKLIVKKV